MLVSRNFQPQPWEGPDKHARLMQARADNELKMNVNEHL
jgi:hypothetical protein